MMKKLIYAMLMVFAITLVGCSNNDGLSYTQSELEAFLIRDCKETVYSFEEQDLECEFDFEKTSKGNVGKYYRLQLSKNRYKSYDFIWDVEPDGSGGVVTISFINDDERIRVRMKHTEEEFTEVTIFQDGTKVENTYTKELWKLDFNYKDDPFK